MTELTHFDMTGVASVGSYECRFLLKSFHHWFFYPDPLDNEAGNYSLGFFYYTRHWSPLAEGYTRKELHYDAEDEAVYTPVVEPGSGLRLGDHVTSSHTYGQRQAIIIAYRDQLVKLSKAQGLHRLERLENLHAPPTIIENQYKTIAKRQSQRWKQWVFEYADRIDDWYKMNVPNRLWQVGKQMAHWGAEHLETLQTEYDWYKKYRDHLAPLIEQGVEWPWEGHLADFGEPPTGVRPDADFDDDDYWYPSDLAETKSRMEELADQMPEARACMAAGKMVYKLVSLYLDTVRGAEEGIPPERLEHPLYAAVFVLGLVRSAYYLADKIPSDPAAATGGIGGPVQTGTFPHRWDIQSPYWQDLHLGAYADQDFLNECFIHEARKEENRVVSKKSQNALLAQLFGDASDVEA